MSASTLGNSALYGMDVLRTYGHGFAGREAELEALDRAWTEGARVFVLHAEGGMGKTRVVSRWLMRMRDAGWRGARRVFVHSFYSQGSDERRNASSELFFDQALTYFGHPRSQRPAPAELGRTMAQLLIEQRGLMVLDGIEPLQHPPALDQGRLKDPALQSLLLSLAVGEAGRSSEPSLCVITSRQPVVELQDKTGQKVIQQPLDRLDTEAGAQLLRQLAVRGPERELREAVEDAHGHAYSLMLLGSYLSAATADHDIRRRHEIPLLEEDAEHRYHARHLFGAYVRHLGESSPEVAVLRLLGLFDRPAAEDLLAVLVLGGGAGSNLDPLLAPLRRLAPPQWNRCLHRLRDLRLISRPASPSPALDSHPLLREYFAEQLRMHFPHAWQAGHRRLFEHLCAATERQPATVPGLQPLYQAVAHGCHAGLYQQACDGVYRDRILRGTGADGFFSTRKLGAIGADLGALAHFFITPWTELAPGLEPSTQAWLLQEAAYRLRAQGRLGEAVEPMRAGLAIAVEQGDWESATIYASNLSELELTRGELTAAVAAGEQAVEHAGRRVDDNGESSVRSRTALADALHQAGRYEDSWRLFLEVESRQGESYPVSSFVFCDLLLSSAERAAWLCFLAGPAGPRPEGGEPLPDSPGLLKAVIERVSRTLAPGTRSKTLLSAAFDHLTFARALLFQAQLPSPLSPEAHDHMAAAIQGFEAAGTKDHLPRGLLARAWLRFISGDESGCRADLDEAWEIAEGGPMPLFQADIQLARARLFRDRSALAEARRLIEKHGYGRRLGELVDAEAAATEWKTVPVPPLRNGLEPEPVRDQVFISYSHRDVRLLEELLGHLKPYMRSETITPWSDQRIAAGARWRGEILQALERAKVAVLLVSPDFLASDFIHSHELGPLLRKAEAGGVRILWVQLRASSFEETPLKEYQATVPPEKPLAEMSKARRDKAWVRLCREIKKALEP